MTPRPPPEEPTKTRARFNRLKTDDTVPKPVDAPAQVSIDRPALIAQHAEVDRELQGCGPAV